MDECKIATKYTSRTSMNGVNTQLLTEDEEWIGVVIYTASPEGEAWLKELTKDMKYIS